MNQHEQVIQTIERIYSETRDKYGVTISNSRDLEILSALINLNDEQITLILNSAYVEYSAHSDKPSPEGIETGYIYSQILRFLAQEQPATNMTSWYLDSDLSVYMIYLERKIISFSNS